MRALSMLLLTGCLGDPTWMAHPCGNGDPVSIECDAGDEVYSEPTLGLCEDLAVSSGDPCETVDERCVLERSYTCGSHPERPASSEAYLHCRNREWAENDHLCPQSSRDVKRDIVYVGAQERAALAGQVMDIKLARYHYRDPVNSGKKLGYILEDSPEAVFSGEGRVDLYAYLSALVATTQEQQAQIEALRAEVASLKAQQRAQIVDPAPERTP